MTKPLTAADYLDNPERAIALFNSVLGSGGSDEAVKQALLVVALALERAGFGRQGCIRNPD